MRRRNKALQLYYIMYYSLKHLKIKTLQIHSILRMNSSTQSSPNIQKLNTISQYQWCSYILKWGAFQSYLFILETFFFFLLYTCENTRQYIGEINFSNLDNYYPFEYSKIITCLFTTCQMCQTKQKHRSMSYEKTVPIFPRPTAE